MTNGHIEIEGENLQDGLKINNATWSRTESCQIINKVNINIKSKLR